MYFVNWQRDVSIEELDGRKVVVKRNKSTKEFHELLLSATYSLISILMAKPSRPSTPAEIMSNEGPSLRKILSELGIPTPELISMGDTYLVEELVEGGDLYRALVSGDTNLASGAGVLTGRAHVGGFAFVDNKAQNYLLGAGGVVRTDLGFTRKTDSEFARSMDIGSFLASVMDLERYPAIERAFFSGYSLETGRKFSALAIALRNMLSLGFSSNGRATFQNMLVDSRPLIGF